MTVLVKNIKTNNISETQLQVLLGYAEEDIYDQSRQATAFGLLKVNQWSCSQKHFLCNVRCAYVCVCVHTPGNSVQEARRSRDGGGDEKSGQVVGYWQQRYDQNPLSTGTNSFSAFIPTHLQTLRSSF